MIRKYNKFIEYIKEEAGIRDIKNIISKHKETYNNLFEIWFHQDLDGVFSAISMREYLKKYGMELYDSHIIQYGDIEFAIKNSKDDNMCVLVDYANFKTMFNIATDHHQSQSGSSSGTSHTKPSRSNAETISGEISNTEIFTNDDIKVVQIIDSADFFRNNINVEDIQNAIFNYDKSKSTKLNRRTLGFVVNRLILSLKNKRISGKSLDGKRDHINKNLLECLVIDSNASVYSLFLNLKHYINTFTSLEWDFKQRSHNVPKKLITPEEINNNLQKYIDSRKNTDDIKYIEDYNIIIQNGIGNVFDTGSYDRYVVFKNNMNGDFLVNNFYTSGLIQVSCNPFKEKKLSNIDLGKITMEVISNYKNVFSKINISLSDIKKVNEILIDKMYKRYGSDYNPVGFKYEDLLNNYSDCMIYLLDDNKTISKVDLNNNNITNNIERCFNMLYSEWSEIDKEEMSKIKIPFLNIVLRNSGGHASITNLQGFQYLSTRPDILKILFKTDNYMTMMKVVSNKYIEILKDKIDSKTISYNYDKSLELGSSVILENFEYFLSNDGNVKSVSKDDFIKYGIELSTDIKNPNKVDKVFKIEIEDNKVIGEFL